MYSMEEEISCYSFIVDIKLIVLSISKINDMHRKGYPNDWIDNQISLETSIIINGF